MKYIKDFNLFLEEVDSDPEGTDDIQSAPVTPDTTGTEIKKGAVTKLQKISKDLDEFKQKRGNLEKILKDPQIKTDVELNNQLLTKIYNNKKDVADRNKFLKDYESVLKSDRRKKRLQDAINTDQQNLAKLKSDKDEQISILKDQMQDADKDELGRINSEIEQVQSQKDIEIKKISSNISYNSETLQRDIINWQKKKLDYQKDMQEEEKRIKTLSDNLQK
jgi:hypothetical protein